MSEDSPRGAETPEAVSRLVELLRHFDAATLITRTRAGSLHGRPMSIAQVEDNVTIWFVTSAASVNAEELAEDGRAMVTLQSSTRFISVNGLAELVFDPARLAAFGNESYRAWYDGATDLEVALVRFTPFDAEYWNEESSPSHARLRLWDPDAAGGGGVAPGHSGTELADASA